MKARVRRRKFWGWGYEGDGLTGEELELLAPVGLNIVCFGYRGADNAAIAADLQEAGRVAPSTTTLNGRTAIRAAIVNHRTGPEDIEALVTGVLALGRAQTRRP